MHPETADPAAVPPLRSEAPRGYYRLRGVAVLLLCAGVLVIAALLVPSRGGYGTHEQLGMPACAFRVRTGLPCPSCGLTTSLSAVMHGQWRLAWHAQPFGYALAAGLATLGIVGGLELGSDRSLLHRLRPGLWWLVAGLIGLMAGWGIVLLTGWLDGSLPAH
ncbi:MAG: DUF2752 domain-containing protein [Phycisphaerae bacterium]|nr:DUF2752 domain-containing protein [Phycisphaerae bacterium]